MRFRKKAVGLALAATLFLTGGSGFSLSEPLRASAAQDEDILYKPEFAGAKKEKLPVVQGKDGSWFVETEDMLIYDELNVVADETASGEKYTATPFGAKTFLAPTGLPRPHASVAFEVEERGAYWVWLRDFTPEAIQKSSWIGIDRSDYFMRQGTLGNWKWSRGSNPFYLDAGTHTLDYCYRQPGHRIDCFIITRDADFKPTGLGALPGETPRPDALPYAERTRPRVYVDDVEIQSSMKCVKDGDAFVVPARRMCDLFGATYYETDDYVLMSRDRDYLKVWKDSKRAILNGREKTLKATAFTTEVYYLSLDLDIMIEAFGGSYTVGENNRIDFTPPEIKEEIVESDDIEMTEHSEGFSFFLTYDNPDASVIAYAKRPYDKVWELGNKPRYSGGGFRGAFGRRSYNTTYILKLVVADGFGAKTFYKTIELGEIERRHNLELTGDAFYEYQHVPNYIPKAPELLLKPTFENIGYYIDAGKNVSACNVYYREKGETEWKKVYPPDYDPHVEQFRGSIVGLREDSEYEVKAELFVGASKLKESRAQCATWSGSPPIAKEYRLSELYDPEENDGALNLDFLKGSPDGWIKIVGVEGDREITASSNISNAVSICNAEYVILDNLLIQGGHYHGILVGNDSHDIRITNCEITNTGHYSIMYEGASRNYLNGNASAWGIRLMYVANVVIERCYIHDLKAKTGHWGWAHPNGSQAVMVRSAGGVVIRYNDFIGSDERRWDDAIGSSYNDQKTGGPSLDTDYYGNVFQYCNDDGLETDGGQMNVRVYNNKIEGAYCGISTAPIMAGPVYLFRNLIINMGDERGSSNSVTKNGGGYGSIYAYSRSYNFHNTIFTNGKGLAGVGFSSLPNRNVLLATTRNNIIVTSGETISDPLLLTENDFDYDLLSKIDGSSAVTKYSEGQEKNGVFQYPKFAGAEAGLYELAEKSPGIDQGCVIDNFSDGYKGKAPDMGALERGDDEAKKSIPNRPVDIWADKYSMTLAKGSSETTVTLYIGDIGKETRFKIRINDPMKKWMSVTDENGAEEGILTPNSEMTLTVRTNSELVGADYPRGNGAFLVRLEDGFSVPFTVYATK